jgi:hypothetical protein
MEPGLWWLLLGIAIVGVVGLFFAGILWTRGQAILRKTGGWDFDGTAHVLRQRARGAARAGLAFLGLATVWAIVYLLIDLLDLRAR